MKILWLNVLLFLLLSCSNDTCVLNQESLEEQGPVAERDTVVELVHDTVFVASSPVVDTQYVYRRDTIVSVDSVVFVDTVIAVDTVVSTDTVYVFNTDTVVIVHRDIQPPLDDLLEDPQGADTMDIVYFGNSLVKGYDSFGMSASTSNYDFCARVNRYFSLQGFYVMGTRVSSTIFERLTDKSLREEIVSGGLYPQLSPKTDVVVIQLGDNVTDEVLLDEFKVSFRELVDSVKSRVSDSTKIICVSSWYSTAIVDQARETVRSTAAEKGCVFVDISDLYADERNRSFLGAVIYRTDVQTYSLSYESISEIACSLTITFSVNGKSITSTIVPDDYSIDAENKVVTWVGHEFIVSNPEIASHPGNQGFNNIAERIIEAISR